jgi:hypothetical protein
MLITWITSILNGHRHQYPNRLVAPGAISLSSTITRMHVLVLLAQQALVS